MLQCGVTLLSIRYTVIGPTQLKFVSAHAALRMLLGLSQSVNCIFCPTKTLNRQVAASKLHELRKHIVLLSTTVYLLYCVIVGTLMNKSELISVAMID